MFLFVVFVFTDKDIPVTPPAYVTVTSVNDTGCTGQNIVLVCVAEKFYPDHVTVHWETKIKDFHVATDSAAVQTDDKFYSITSRLKIPLKQWNTGLTIKCTVSFYNGTVTHPVSGEITGPKGGCKKHIK